MDSAIASLCVSPEASFLREEAREAKGKCLVLKEKRVSDSEFAVMLRSMKNDTYFAAIDVTDNQITDVGAGELANFITSGMSAVQIVHIERNCITDKGGEQLFASKKAAFQQSHRNWLIHTRGNPMSESLVLSLQTNIVELDEPKSSRPASSCDSFPSIIGPSPIPERGGDRRSQASNRSDELLEGSLQLSEVISHSGDLADLSDPLDSEVVNLRSQCLISIPEQLSFALHLKRLSLADNQISQIDHLPQYLEALELRKNRIQTISGLDYLASLLYLDLSENDIGEIRGLQGNFALREISLAHNGIREIAGLEHLRELRKLHVGDNCISTFLSIRTISMNTSLKSLILQGNPICLQAKYKASVTSLLPRLSSLDSAPLSSYRNESFSKAHPNSSFFSIDFVDMRPDSARAKVTPRFPVKQSISPSFQSSIVAESPESDQYSHMIAQAIAPNPKPKAPRTKKKTKKTGKTPHEKPIITITPPPPPPQEKPASVFSIAITPEEPITSVPLSEQEKEAIHKHLRALVLFRGLQNEFFQGILERAEKERCMKGDVLQDGSLLVSRLLLILSGRVQWKRLTHGAWTALFLESLITPTEAEDNVISLEPTFYISFDRDLVMDVLEKLPEAKAGFYRNYDNLQASREQRVLAGLESVSSDVSRRPPSTIPKKSSPSQSTFLPKGSFPQLTKPDVSHTFAFSTVSSDPRSQRVQAEIQKLLATDPFRPETDSVVVSPPAESFSAWQEAVSALKSTVSRLGAFHDREALGEKESAEVEKEAERFVEAGPLHTYEMMAMERTGLRQCVEQAFLMPLSQSISEIRNEGLFEEYASILGKGDEDEYNFTRLLSKLELWTSELEGEMQSCMLAISNVLLFGKDESLVLARLSQDRVATVSEELSDLLRNPKAFIEKTCRHKASDPILASRLTSLLSATNRNNYCKRSLQRLLTAINTRNDQEIDEIRKELVQEGVLSFGMTPCKGFVKGEHREMELKTRANLWKSKAVKADSSVASEVSSPR